jgi:hypothetical protein
VQGETRQPDQETEYFDLHNESGTAAQPQS